MLRKLIATTLVSLTLAGCGTAVAATTPTAAPTPVPTPTASYTDLCSFVIAIPADGTDLGITFDHDNMTVPSSVLCDKFHAVFDSINSSTGDTFTLTQRTGVVIPFDTLPGVTITCQSKGFTVYQEPNLVSSTLATSLCSGIERGDTTVL